MGSQTVTKTQTAPAVIESGRILDVDVTTYTVTITTEFTKKPATGVKFATPYQHYDNGEGIYFMPEVGSLCWVCFPSDHNRPFVLAWGPASDDGDARAKKKDLNPGDIYLGTRDENFLILRRGGVVQIGGGPLSQRLYLPINNTIKDFCENYSLQTFGGNLDWTVQRDVNTTDGKRPALLSLSAKEFADDPSPVAQLQIGSHGNGDDRILSLLIKESGQDGAADKIELSLGKDGSVKWHVTKDVEWTVDGDFKVKSKNLNLEASDAVTVKGKTIDAEAQSGVKIKASAGNVEVEALLVKLNNIVQAGGTQPVAMAIPLITWLVSHTHTSGPPGSPTSPPVVPPTGSISSQSLFAK